MDEIDKRRLLIGVALLLLGSDAALSLPFHHNLASISFFIFGILLVSFSNESWGETFEDVTPDFLSDLFYYPRLPYFQTGIAALVFLVSFLFIPSYLGMIIIWLGLAISQALLMTIKKNIQDRVKMLTAMKFHIFLFFSTFFYLMAERLFLFQSLPDLLPPVLVLTAWVVVVFHVYLSLRS
ncbi:MAG: hypothetical protein V5A88_01210 [Candidatus Thermoplasmatota archaeon]